MRHRGTLPPVLAGILAFATAGGCHRASGIPPVPAVIPSAADSTRVALARRLAPVLYVQRDEPFPLDRIVAVVHPRCPVVAYILDWRWDVNGQWMPWTKSSDEEEVWVGYDPETLAPTDLWTYWHGTVLHTEWRDRGHPAVDVQWGKHGNLPRGVVESDLPSPVTLNAMYALEFVLLPDVALGKLVHGGPWGFFHSYARYRDFSRVTPTRDRLTAVIVSDSPTQPLRVLLGSRFSNKVPWPLDMPAAAPVAPSDASGVNHDGGGSCR